MPANGTPLISVPADVAAQLRPEHLVWENYPTHPNGLPGASDPLLRLRAVLDTGARLRPWPSLHAAVTELRDRAAAEQQRLDDRRRPIGARAAGF